MTDPTFPPGNPAEGRWRLIAAAVLVLAAVVCGAVLFVGGDGGAPPKRPQGPGSEATAGARSAAEALDLLAGTSAEVSASLSYSSIADLERAEAALAESGPVSTVPGVDPDTVGTADASMPIEAGVVDFSAGTAVSVDSGSLIPPAVVVDGVTYLDFTSAPMGSALGVTGWVEFPAETMVGIDTKSTTLRALLDLVASRDVWLSDAATEGPEGTFTVDVDTGAVTARDDERLARLDATLRSMVEGELASGLRARVGGHLQVSVGDDGLPVRVRVEMVTAGQVATLTWDLSGFGTKVDAQVPDGELTDYATFASAAAEAMSPRVQEPGALPPEIPSDLEGAVVPAPDPAEFEQLLEQLVGQ